MADGEVAGAKKWHAYRYPQEPGKLLILGSILSDPKEPESSLNLDDGAVPVLTLSLYTDSPTERRTVEAELVKSTHILLKIIPSSLLPGVQANVGGNINRTSQTVMDALNVRVKWFRPSKEYMELALQDQNVKEFARKCLFSKSLYMIVGVATTGKLELTEMKGAKNGAHLSADAALSATGTEVGGEISHDKARSLSSSLETVGGFDFAYRVREFVYSKRKGMGKMKDDLTKGAMFGGTADDTDSDSDEEGVDEDLKPIPQFEYFEEKDVNVAL